MHISGLWVQNFRNITDKNWQFQPGLNIFTAPNGSGKSNMIESIHLLSTGQSWRARQTDELVQWESEFGKAQAKVELQQGSEPLKLEQFFTRGTVQGKRTNKRLYRINGVNRRAHDAIGQLLTVSFTPEDMELFQAGAGARRRLLDSLLDQISPEYRRARQLYEKALRHRNKLLQALRERQAQRADFFYWDQLLITNGSLMHDLRSDFLQWLNGQEGIKEQYQIEYDHSVISEQRLLQYERAEVSSGHTLVGPHKDGVVVSVLRGKEWRDISMYGSRGEQRMALIWWKLSEAKYIEDRRQETPVLLLDDVFSELDDDNQQRIADAAHRGQAIITTVEEGYTPLYNEDHVSA